MSNNKKSKNDDSVARFLFYGIYVLAVVALSLAVVSKLNSTGKTDNFTISADRQSQEPTIKTDSKPTNTLQQLDSSN